MIDLLVAGGWVMPLIVACSVVALSISIERYIALDRSKVAPPHLLATVWRDLKQGELNALKLAQLRTNSPLGAILAAGIGNRGQGRDVMKESISEAASHVVHDLEKYLNSPGTVAAIAPLLGLLGTVVGMIDVFTQITTVGTGNANALAGGISEARLTTAAGLIVAITALVMHRYYTGLIDTIVVHLEREAIKLVDAIHNGAGQDYTT
jgi:biopolymer transport protein ExbB